MSDITRPVPQPQNRPGNSATGTGQNHHRVYANRIGDNALRRC
jgi:hypothetical protein